MKSYLEISISSNETQRELLIPTMVEMGCEGFQETDTSLLCYLERTKWNETKQLALTAELKRLLQLNSVNALIQFREFADENWNEQWESTLQPIEIGEKLVIKPTWCTYKGSWEKIVIEIDPKMSFGTGYHETTRLTLCLLEKYVTSGMTVLDVGTGSGILAIAAVKLGAVSAIGIDIDEWSIENATENVVRNKVQDRVSISSSPIHDLPFQSFNLITANLTLNTNIEFLEDFERLLRMGGTLLLSGLLLQDKGQMIQGLRSSKFKLIEDQRENEWIALAAKLSP